MWVLVVMIIYGSYGQPITISGFKNEEDCRAAAAYAVKMQQGDTRVRDAFCLMGPAQ